ncbi:MAG TPA: DNA polymerase/3'-5' exonuclease PolX [Pseudogracilibacillus sp.]|nr:DNA polymerase/3'-5' exonuclease PolX [Pseudogracilibacillus sp.]
MALTKKDLIQHLEDIAVYLELKGENQFRISAYRKAAQNIETDIRSLKEINDFKTIKGIGDGTNEIIKEFINKGKSEVLESLKNEVPEGLIPLLKLPGIGGKRLATLYKELDVVDLESLEYVCQTGAVEKVKGFGKKTTENILKAISKLNMQPERLPISLMLPLAEKIHDNIKEIAEVKKSSIAGSIRRMEETIKDIDFIIATDHPKLVTEKLLLLDNIHEIIASGETKTSVTIKEDNYLINIDFRLIKPEEYPTTLHHFTGSKEHNIAMRQRAKERGEKINEYGVEIESSGKLIQFQTEEEFFQHFNLEFIPPEVRGDGNEVSQFESATHLIEKEMIKGDLHMHTTWSDGAESIEDMVQAARKLGYDYLAITDHSKFLRVANGLTEKRLREQAKEIERLNKKYSDILILSGVEMDILPNGELDFDSEFLKEMDIVIAAIHSSFSQSEAEIMHRLEAACKNPYVDIIAHPTGRLIGQREPYAVNMEQLIQLAKETNTVLEINAHPQRFDLSAKWANEAQKQGVNIAINTDAHQTNTLSYMNYGVSVGKKAWLKPETIINTWDKSDLLAFINRNK